MADLFSSRTGPAQHAASQYAQLPEQAVPLMTRPSPPMALNQETMAPAVNLMANVMPGIGDALSARDAYQAGRGALSEFRQGNYGRGALAAGEAALGGLGALPLIPNMAGIIKAYHGSPHQRFPKFDFSKIGTGEGQQAFGYGGYFAEADPTGRAYRDALKGQYITTANGNVPRGDAFQRLVEASRNADPTLALSQHESIARDVLEGIEESGSAKKYLSSYELPTGKFGASFKAVSDAASEQGFKRNKGSFYEVTLAPDHEDLLDWDAPLSEQSPKVRERLEKSGFRGSGKWNRDAFEDGLIYRTGARGVEADIRPVDRGNGNQWLANYYTLDQDGSKLFESLDEAKEWIDKSAPIEAGRGAEIYQSLRDRYGSDSNVSAALREAGIPGIRYLDAGSRSAKDGTRNIVLFDDNLVSIDRVE